MKLIRVLTLIVSMFITSESFALPIFSRQTGYECSLCHFQNFPMLNAFGRSFKNSGFTMIGNDGKVETDQSKSSAVVSIPDHLNFGVLTTIGVGLVSSGKSTLNPNSVADTVNMPANGGELSLFYGGRISENLGFLLELGTTGSAESSTAKLPIFYEVSEGTRVGVVFLTTDGQGAAHSFETLNTGAVAMQRMVPNLGVSSNNTHIKVNSAAQYLNTTTGAQGASLVVNNEHYFVNVGKYAVINKLGTDTKSGSMRLSYVRAAEFFDIFGFDSAIGVQFFRGDDGGAFDNLRNSIVAINPTEASIIDAQTQVLFYDYPLGIYFSYGTAPAATNNTGGVNLFNSFNVVTATTMNVAIRFGIIPGKATLMGAMRTANNGAVDASGVAVTDNAWTMGASYTLVKNVEASLEYTTQSGTAWYPINGVDPAGKTVITFMLQSIF